MRNKHQQNKKFLPGSALVLSLFMLSGMILVSLAGAYIVVLGIKAGGIQSQSTKAYFAAESGAEYLLWELRQNSYSYSAPGEEPIFEGSLPATAASYRVYFKDFPPLIFNSIGDFQSTKRSVEIKI